MAWITPKVNWAPVDGVTNADMNRIEGNTQYLYDAHAAHLADYIKQIPYGAATGSANTYAVTLSPAPSAYVEGIAIAVKINVENTGPSTINVNGLGAVAIKKPNGNDVSAGNLKAGSIYTLRYNGVNFILQGEGGGGTAQPGDVLSGKTFTNDSGDQIGTMINKVGSGTVIISSTIEQAIPQGYYGGAINDGKVISGVTPGGIPFAAADTERVTGETYYVKLKEIRINLTGTVRVYFELKSGGSSYNAYARIYKNDVPVGTEHITTSTTYVAFSEDIAVNAGDLVQLYAKCPASVADVRLFRLCAGGFATVIKD